VTASWDKTIRLWDLDTNTCKKPFKGHTKDVMSVTFSPEYRQIVSCSRDRTVRIWNILGDEKHKIDNAHEDWATCVR
jgi:guanine nucleotide-binding protein subunit beta-2-like 1 protein